MKIILVRHAESEANINPFILQEKTNMLIDLTEKGESQGKDVGDFLLNYLKREKNDTIKIWNSPYLRTRKTAELIKKELKKEFVFQQEESIYIAERQFGLADTIKDYRFSYKNDMNYYKMYKKDSQDFWVRPPGGESPFDMCLRLDFFLKKILDKNIDVHIVITHGAAIRGLEMMYLNKKYDEYNKETPNNCSVHLLENLDYKILKS